MVSGGRLEFGLGRGYQPRETEVLGGPLGATIQDQERNRAYFEEAYEIIMKCWTQESFSHHGEFFTIPPSYTRWNHKQTIAYFNEPGNGRDLEDVIAIGGPDMYSAGSPVLATTTKLLELQVYPQPVQKPYPQMWQPLTSPRSIEFAAQHGINGYFIVEPNNRLKQNIETYYAAAEKAGYPDRLDRGEFKYGWDASSHRGIITGRYIHINDHGHRRHGQGGSGPGGAVGLLRPVRLRRRPRRAGRDRRHGSQGDGRRAAPSAASPSTARSTR